VRIALFTDTFPPTVNGVARAVGLLVDHAARAGHEVAVVSPRGSGKSPHEPALHLELPSRPAPFYPELRISLPRLGRQRSRELERFEPDLVHCATEASVGWAGRRWALSRAVPLVSSYCTHFAEYAAGDGPSLPELRRRGLEGVHFTGYRHGEDLASTYASADVFVFPSDTETFGQVVTEAFASGLPAIGPARGGVLDLVRPGRTGLLFGPPPRPERARGRRGAELE
jgi:glycosyltransferase involved in cell wall biosynthesis